MAVKRIENKRLEKARVNTEVETFTNVYFDGALKHRIWVGIGAPTEHLLVGDIWRNTSTNPHTWFMYMPDESWSSMLAGSEYPVASGNKQAGLLSVDDFNLIQTASENVDNSALVQRTGSGAIKVADATANDEPVALGQFNTLTNMGTSVSNFDGVRRQCVVSGPRTAYGVPNALYADDGTEFALDVSQDDIWINFSGGIGSNGEPINYMRKVQDYFIDDPTVPWLGDNDRGRSFIYMDYDPVLDTMSLGVTGQKPSESFAPYREDWDPSSIGDPGDLTEAIMPWPHDQPETPDGIASSSGHYSDRVPWRVFDHNRINNPRDWLSTSNLSTSPSPWIKYEYRVPRYIKKFALRAGRHNFTTGQGWYGSPESFRIEASNNDVDWDIISNHTGVSWTYYGDFKEFTIDTPGLYKYYRLVFLNNWNGGTAYRAQLNEWRMYGEADHFDIIGNKMTAAGHSGARQQVCRVYIGEHAVEELSDSTGWADIWTSTYGYNGRSILRPIYIEGSELNTTEKRRYYINHSLGSTHFDSDFEIKWNQDIDNMHDTYEWLNSNEWVKINSIYSGDGYGCIINGIDDVQRMSLRFGNTSNVIYYGINAHHWFDKGYIRATFSRTW